MAPKGGVRNRLGLPKRGRSPDTEGNSGATSSSGTAAAASSSAPRRGVRQRIQRSADATEGDKDLPFTMSLKKQWAAGELSSRQVQELAYGAGEQGAHSVERMGKAGNSGASPQHLQRALIGIFGQPPGAPGFTWVPVPMMINKHERIVPQPMLLPHLYFQSLFEHKPDLWNQSVVGPDPVGALHFWQDMRKSAFVQEHPHLSRPHWGQTIPLGLHGDGADSTSTNRSSCSPGTLCWGLGPRRRSDS